MLSIFFNTTSVSSFPLLSLLSSSTTITNILPCTPRGLLLRSSVGPHSPWGLALVVLSGRIDRRDRSCPVVGGALPPLVELPDPSEDLADESFGHVVRSLKLGVDRADVHGTIRLLAIHWRISASLDRS